jgi:hypothetical protein
VLLSFHLASGVAFVLLPIPTSPAGTEQQTVIKIQKILSVA